MEFLCIWRGIDLIFVLICNVNVHNVLLFLYPSELTTTCSAGILSAFDYEGNPFSIRCSTGGYLLDCLKVIVSAIFCVSPLIDC
jgi:hypothetical protein